MITNKIKCSQQLRFGKNSKGHLIQPSQVKNCFHSCPDGRKPFICKIVVSCDFAH